MKYLWFDPDHEVDIPYGNKVVGLHKEGRRPLLVAFSHEELTNLLSLWNKDIEGVKARNYLLHLSYGLRQ